MPGRMTASKYGKSDTVACQAEWQPKDVVKVSPRHAMANGSVNMYAIVLWQADWQPEYFKQCKTVSQLHGRLNGCLNM
jgi:hypothetical protein